MKVIQRSKAKQWEMDRGLYTYYTHDMDQTITHGHPTHASDDAQSVLSTMVCNSPIDCVAAGDPVM